MNRVAAIFFCGFVPLAIAGCTTVHRKFAAQNPASTAHANFDKLPLTVAVISDPALTFDYPRHLTAFVEVLNPGLAQTLQAAFRDNFQDVSVVEAGQAASGADLIASPTLSLSDPMKLTVTFVDPRSRRIVAEVSSERSCDGHAPGVYAHLGTDLMLFAAVVVFPPADRFAAHEINKHDADRFNAGFAPAVSRMAGDISYKASRDQNLHSFATPPAQYVDNPDSL
jgi:hypothetical protein